MYIGVKKVSEIQPLNATGGCKKNTNRTKSWARSKNVIRRGFVTSRAKKSINFTLLMMAFACFSLFLSVKMSHGLLLRASST